MKMKLPTFFAYSANDTVEVRVEKFAVLLVAGSCCLAGCIWTGMYFSIFGLGLTTLLPSCFVAIVGSALIISHISKNHQYAIYAQIICIIYITAFIQWSIGGVFDSGFVLVWAFLGPLTALMFFSPRRSILWFLLYLVNVAITIAFDEQFASGGQLVSESTRLFFLLMNMAFASTVVFVFASYFVSSALNEREKANDLLLNVLPEKIVPILKANRATIADHFDSASVLFADIVGSTPLFSDLDPAEAVDWLNEIFSRFDRLVEKYGLEKIRTIGDNYMIASGVPDIRDDHAKAMAHLALDMVEECKAVPARNGRKIAFRLGIHSGPLVAGVIGKTKFHYDLWGDTVNTASRMESHGKAGRVHISKATYELLAEDFECKPRGPISIKGKGEMETRFLIDRKV